MAQQNIFDDEVFFDGYKKLRDQEVNANILFEIPALTSLLPDLEGKEILDLGCGFGEHCVEYVKRGAKRVVGIDLSEKMIFRNKLFQRYHLHLRLFFHMF